MAAVTHVRTLGYVARPDLNTCFHELVIIQRDRRAREILSTTLGHDRGFA